MSENWFEDKGTSGGATASSPHHRTSATPNNSTNTSSSSSSDAASSTIASHDDISARIASNFAESAFGETQRKISSYYGLYANIDFVRPYFDVELDVVLKRLADSLNPLREIPEREMDLYGPVMTCFTLVSMLLFRIKQKEGTDNVKEQGTAMGAAFAVVFTYWMFISALMFFTAFLLGQTERVSPAYIVTATGYAIFGYVLSVICDFALSGPLLLGAWIVFGGLSSAALARVFYGRCDANVKVLMSVVPALIHFGYLFYLEILYFQVVSNL